MSNGIYSQEGHGFSDIKKMYKTRENRFPLDFHKVLAIEGSMVTVLGNLHFDTKTCKFELQPLAFIGGGLDQVKEYL